MEADITSFTPYGNIELLPMKRIIITALITLASTNYAFGQQIYKIVDADGNVTFSQIEPALKNSDPIKVEELKISNANNAMSTVRTELGRQMCGNIHLPYDRTKNRSNKTSSSNYYVQSIVNSKKNWKSSLSRLSKQMVKSSKYNMDSRKRNQSSSYAKQRNSQYQKSSDINNSRIRDLRCAINWAESKGDFIKENHKSKQTEKMRLIAISDKLTASIKLECGEEPIYDPSSGANKEHNKRWKNCSSAQRRDLRNVKRKIDRF